MPCWTVSTYSVKFKAENQSLLELALVRLGIEYQDLGNGRLSLQNGKVVLDLANEKATYQGQQEEFLNQIRRGYSMECLNYAADQNGWSVQLEAGEHAFQGQLVKQSGW